ncbi:hypothetical protein [Pseudomonas borbori]|uniref:Uncharacterized protein n=1 Tax=Pseudomonas borbori TaxID=289003 RepID=A0A1I5LPA5_9PSED|nr:hypothetical protein [Pseudomonas borbori]SFO98656.1 hypothetical protein SAMN05216190_103141 [Pseudomonas borbori]
MATTSAGGIWGGNGWAVSTASELALDRFAYESLIGGRSFELSTFLRVVLS